jgi:GNAT superfamily N-acetyltransferase
MTNRPLSTVLLRLTRPSDAPTAGGICHVAFKIVAERHGFPPDFPDAQAATCLLSEMLSRRDIYGVAAEHDGVLIGSNFLWMGDGVAGVGPITVDPALQNSGVGRALMSAVVRRASEIAIPSVRLVQAAYHNRSLSLYTDLGFQVREPLSVFQGRALHLTLEGCRVRPATADDIAPANAFCTRVHGHSRENEFRAAIDQGTASVAERDRRMTGYTTGIGFLGHAVGETDEDIEALIGAAQSFGGPGFLVPTRNAALMRWCLRHGLRIVQSMSLMTLGPYQEPAGSYLPSVLY